MSVTGADQGLAQDECSRCGSLAAKAARRAEPGSRSSGDVLKLRRLIQSRNCFFAGFSPEVLEDVCQNLEYLPMLAKKTIFSEGMPANYVYVIATGRVNLVAIHRNNKPCPLIAGADGGEVPVSVEAAASGAWHHHKSRTTIKRRLGIQELQDLGEALQEGAQAEAKTRTKLTPMQRFRSAIAAIKTEGATSHAFQGATEGSNLVVKPRAPVQTGGLVQPTWSGTVQQTAPQSLLKPKLQPLRVQKGLGKGTGESRAADRSRTPISRQPIQPKGPPPGFVNALPFPWQEEFSEEFDLNYYWNPDTAEAVWEKPEA